MSFSQTPILRGIFSSSSLFSQMSKLPLNLPAQFIMLKAFQPRLSHLTPHLTEAFSPPGFCPHPPQCIYPEGHPSLPSSDPSASQPMLITSKLIVFTFSTLHFCFFSLSTFPCFHFHPGSPQLFQRAICS